MRIQNETGYYMMVELQGRVDLAADYPGYEHFHPFWELVWADEPLRIYVQDSCMVTHAALLPAGVHHRVQGAGKPARMLYLGFRFSDSGTVEGSTLQWPDDPALEQACAALLALPQQDFLTARSGILQLLALVQNYLPGQAAAPSCNDPLVEKVKQLCDPYSCYTVRQMADMLYVSANHLGNTFFAVTGMHIKQYQTLVRMQEALRLLVADTAPIADIAAKLGYTSTSYFIRCFEQHYHRTPGAMRSALANREDPISAEETVL